MRHHQNSFSSFRHCSFKYIQSNVHVNVHVNGCLMLISCSIFRMEDILPGPVSQEVILDNSYHVSADVWDGVDRGPLECICGNRSMRSWFLSDAQKEILHAIWRVFQSRSYTSE